MSVLRLGLLSASLLGAACGGGGGFPDAPPIDQPPPQGKFTLAWTVTDMAGGAVTCDQLGAQTVTIGTHLRVASGGNTEVFSCASGMGQSAGLDPGLYDMTFELDGQGGDPQTGLVATAPEQKGVTITSGQSVALMPLTFAVNATGGVKLAINSGKVGGNCAGTTNGGAGITGMTLTLSHVSGGACEPITLTYPANATLPAGSYTIDCTTPVVAPCIETDQPLSASSVKADNYQLHVRGKVGTSDCFTNDDTMRVPPLGRLVDRSVGSSSGPLNLAPAPMGTPGC